MKQKQFIKCPECGSVELAELIGDSKIVSIHECSNCRVLIFDYEWDALPALSIKQPWAWLIVNGYKDIENRNTLKNFRGTFLIHAGMQYDLEWRYKLHDLLSVEKIENLLFKNRLRNEVYQGGIIGFATITNCIQRSESIWFTGKNGFIITNPKPLPFTPCKGSLSFFKPKI